MASTELDEIIKQAEKLPLDQQLYLIARLAEKARAAEASRMARVAEPLVGEELAALLESIDALPLESEPDPDLSTTYREILYPKHGEIP